ncbi:MAG: response regulator [bacterium]
MARRKKTILVIDDEADIRTLLTEEFGRSFKVITAKDGEEGLKRIFEKKPDLVILDIKMPRMNGLEVLRKTKAFFPTLPVVLCTAFSSYRTVYAASLADAFVVKSPDLTELEETVQELINQ